MKNYYRAIVGLVLSFGLVSQCLAVKRVSIEDLLVDKDSFEGKKVVVEGFLGKYCIHIDMDYLLLQEKQQRVGRSQIQVKTIKLSPNVKRALLKLDRELEWHDMFKVRVSGTWINEYGTFSLYADSVRILGKGQVKPK